MKAPASGGVAREPMQHFWRNRQGTLNRIKSGFGGSRCWTDEYEVDSEKKTISLTATLDITPEQKGRLIIEARDELDIVDVYFYYDLKCKETKLEQMALLLNGIHVRWHFGRFEVFPDGYVRWRHRVDFEGSQPTGLSLERIVGPGWDATGKFADVIAAVALTKLSAAEALEEYDAQEETE